MVSYSMDQIRAWAERYKVLLSFSAVGKEFGIEKSVVNKMLRKYKKQLNIEFKYEIIARLAANGLKMCSSCNDIKPMESFYRSAHCVDGFDGRCITCHESARQEYLQSSKGIMSRKNWLDSNRAHIKKTNKEYYMSHKDSVLALHAKWRDTHAIQNKIIGDRNTKRRQERLTKLSDKGLTAEEISMVRHVFENKCVKCGSTRKICLDHHYPLSKGFALTINNVALLCNKCNSSKGSKMPEEFYSEVELRVVQTKILKVGELIHGIQ